MSAGLGLTKIGGTIDKGSMTEEQFDWAVRGALVIALEDMSRRDLAQPTSETYLQIEQFWQAFEVILRDYDRFAGPQWPPQP